MHFILGFLFVQIFTCVTANNFTHPTRYEEYVQRMLNTNITATVPELIQGNGFPVETHQVITKDGYILTLFRIPHGRFQGASRRGGLPKKVVYLLHGNFADSASWVLNTVDKALAYKLADLGNVDVWLGNNRGTRYSLGHVTLSSADYTYWKFGFHEIGDIDLPAVYDYILETTGHPSLYFIAHSMGAAEFLVSMVRHPEYIPKIRGFIALSGAVFQGNTSNRVFRTISPFVRLQQTIHDTLLLGPNFPPEVLPFMNVIGNICSPTIAIRWICVSVLEASIGIDPKEANYEIVPEVMSHILSSTSSQKTFHALQLMNTDDFVYYNFYDRNMEVYLQSTPPKYELQGITVPIVLFCATGDNIVTPEDSRKLAANLVNVIEVNEIHMPKFNHFDYLYSRHINELAHDRIIELIQNDMDIGKRIV